MSQHPIRPMHAFEPPEQRPQPVKKRILRLLGVVILLVVLAILGGSIYIHRQLPYIRSLEDYAPKQATRVLSSEGTLIGQFFTERRRVVPFEKIPKHVVHAFLAAEDADFYAHEGIDWLGILRALVKNMRPGAHLQGASTITQQTVKTLILGPERSYTRKLSEALLARQLEQFFSKDEILALYLNQIYFGNGAWGIEEASQTYFGQSIDTLDVAQAALLAAIPKNPSHYNVKNNPAAAKWRQKYVLEQMQHHRWIDAQTAQAAMQAPIPAPRDTSEIFDNAAYYVEHIRRLLVQTYGDARILEGGMTVTTGLSTRLQAAAVTAIRQGVEDVAKKHGYFKAPGHIEADHLQAQLTRWHTSLEALVHQRTYFAPDPQAADGYVWDLTRRGREYSVRIVPLTDYQRVHAVVIALNPAQHSATIDLGSEKALLPLQNMAWARRYAPRMRTPLPKDPSQVVHVGDIITVDIMPKDTRMAPHGGKQALRTVALVPEIQMQAALVAMEPQTRFVRAMVGGYHPSGGTGFNRATQALRQPGSAFKPILYAAALKSGAITPASICPDSPVSIPDPWTGKTWRPENYEDGRYDGNIRYRVALMRSKNTCSVRLIQRVTPQATIAMARALGITTALPQNLTLALGTGDTTVLELCGAYTSIASQGTYAPPAFIARIVDANGQVLQENHTPVGTPALSPEVAYVLTSMLESVVDQGTAQRAGMLQRPLAGKTGTSQESRNVWFSGFAPQLAATVWMGFDNNEPLGYETGASAALPSWIRFMGAALATDAALPFSMPAHVVRVSIDPNSGLASHADDSIEEVFVEGTEPHIDTQALPSIYLQDDSDKHNVWP